MLIVYFSGVTGNTGRYIQKSGVRAARVPLKPTEQLQVNEEYVLVVPTYGSGDRKIPPQVKKFLATHSRLLRGVIGTGNLNFNAEYCLAAREIATTYNVPLLAEVELAGMESDIKKLQSAAQGDLTPMSIRTAVAAKETPSATNTVPSYMELNAKLGFYAEDGHSLQLDKDREAAREFMLEVNQNTVFFHDIEEKQAYMIEHEYWDGEVLAKYPPEFVKDAFKRAYSHKYRFKSFMSAFKFYTSYAQKTNDGSRYLERYEDRMTMIALTLAEGNQERVMELIDDMVQNRVVYATPTMQNAGKARAGEMVSCFLINASDSLDSIKDTWNYAAQLSKIGGGVAINMTDIREAGAPLKGKEGLAKGIIPWMKVYEDIFSTVDQLGTRQGAGAVYLSIFHPDVLSFLDSKKENADEKTRIKTLSTGLVIPDVFFELVKNNDDIHLISTYDAAREYGIPFSQIDLTAEYQNILNNPRIRKPRKMKARMLLQQIAEVQGESGYPYMMFVDTVNKAHNIDGKVVMSNLCVTGDTRINTSLGYHRIEDLYHSQEDFKVAADRRAIEMNPSIEGVSLEDSTKVFKTAENAEIFELKTVEGHSIKATAWHKFYILRDGELIKIPLAEVLPGDRVLVQSAEGAFGELDLPDLAYVAGVIAGDGTYVQRSSSAGRVTSSVRIDLYGAKKGLSVKVQQAVHAALSDKNELVERQSSLTPEFIDSKASDKVSLHSAPLAKLLDSHGFNKHTKCRVPEFVFSGTRDTVLAYLSGLYQMDGSITGSAGASSVSIELSSIHKQHLAEIQMLLLNLGVYTRIYQAGQGGARYAPNGKGGASKYEYKTLYSLRATSRREVEKLYSLLTWRAEHVGRWEELSLGRKTDKRYSTHKFMAQVESIEFVGREDVYDVTVDNGNSLIFNGIVTGNCVEIAQVTEPSTYNEKTGEIEHVGRDISCNLASLNVYEAMRSKDFGRMVENAVRGLIAVSDMSDIQRVPTVANGNRKSHAIGLGQMGLATYFATEQMMYGDEESLDFTDIYFKTVFYHALRTSNLVAKERGESFYEFEKSKYYTGEAFDKYLVDDGQPKTEKVRRLFAEAGIHVPTKADWEELKRSVREHGSYCAYLTAVAPTGSISYITNTSASIAPVVSKIEIRKEGKLGRVMYPAAHMTNENQEYFVDAYEVGWEKLVDVYAAAQKHVDQSLSMTIFFNEGVTTRDYNKMQITAWKKGIKTIYYTRIRQQAIAGSDIEGCVSCAL